MRALTIILLITTVLTSCRQEDKSQWLNPLVANSGPESLHLNIDNASEGELVAAHLAYAEKFLRGTSEKQLTVSQMRNRELVLDLLSTYYKQGIFPANYEFPGVRRPCFIDADGRVCAVGYLIEQTAGIEAAEKINELHQHDYVMDMQDELLSDWMNEFGFTKHELAIIQPAYDFIEFKRNSLGVSTQFGRPLIALSDSKDDNSYMDGTSSFSVGLNYQRGIRRFIVNTGVAVGRTSFTVAHEILGPHQALNTGQSVEFNTFEIPLSVSYQRWLFWKISMEAHAGVSSMWTSSASETSSYADGTSEESKIIAPGITDWLLSKDIHLGIKYEPGALWSFHVLPYYKHYSKSFHSDWLQSRTSAVGVSARLNYHF